jgi:hypothetical protein
MVTTIREQIKEFSEDFFVIILAVLTLPFFFLLGVVSLIKGESLLSDEGEEI